MPELPEVETIRLGLQKFLVGHTIEKIDVRMPKQLSGDVADVIGAKILGVRRFGKGLVVDLDNSFSIAIHVKMTGQLIYEDPVTHGKHHPVKVGKLPGPATHVIFHFDKHAVLYYNDIRQFGWIKLLKTNSVPLEPYFKSLGPEPLKDLTVEKFGEIVSKKRTPIKQVLMDQALIAGIGNIYANDALFAARLNPKRPASSLTSGEQRTLFDSIESVLKKGLKTGGASEWQYVNALGESGTYQNAFQIYRKNGQPCPRCGTIVETIKMGGRGTFYCPGCQV